MRLLYENSNGNIVVLVRKQDCVNFISSLIHEYVHLCDYNKLSNYRNDLDYRRLQENFVFLFWTEFHATYLTYRYLINFNPTDLDVKNVQNEIVNDLINYYSSSRKLDKNKAINKTVRSYGSYLALDCMYIIMKVDTILRLLESYGQDLLKQLSSIMFCEIVEQLFIYMKQRVLLTGCSVRILLVLCQSMLFRYIVNNGSQK